MSVQLKEGGTLGPADFYVARTADKSLFRHLLQGQLCYVFAPRQMGKSSLRLRCERELSAHGVQCVSVDLGEIGNVSISADSWYIGFIDILCRTLKINTISELDNYWDANNSLSVAQRFTKFLHQELLSIFKGRLVIFVDEIDSLLTLPAVRDDFFTAVRALYNLRADDPNLSRITFCFLGVTSPGALISDAIRTPFNIGVRVPLEDFTRSELDAFAEPLLPLGSLVRAYLNEIHLWTEGHPYMTQKLCLALLQTPKKETESPDAYVERVAKMTFLTTRERDINLTSAERRLEQLPEQNAILALYREIVSKGQVPADPTDARQLELELCGLCALRHDRSKGQALFVRNRVYREVFHDAWAVSKIQHNVLTEHLDRWLREGRESKALLRGEPLRTALQWATANVHLLTPNERAFLLESLDAAVRKAENVLQIYLGEVDNIRAESNRRLEEAYSRRLSLEQSLDAAQEAQSAVDKRLADEVGKARQATARRYRVLLGLAGALGLAVSLLVFGATLSIANDQRHELIASDRLIERQRSLLAQNALLLQSRTEELLKQAAPAPVGDQRVKDTVLTCQQMGVLYQQLVDLEKSRAAKHPR